MTDKSAAGLIRSEIEEKRIRVQKLRERRKELHGGTTPTTTPSPDATLLTPKPHAPVSAAASSMDAIFASIPGIITAKPSEPVTIPTVVPPATTKEKEQEQEKQPQQKRKATLNIALDVAVVDIPQHELLTYSKQTQTTPEVFVLSATVDDGGPTTSPLRKQPSQSQSQGMTSPSTRSRRRSGNFQDFMSSSMEQLPPVIVDVQMILLLLLL